MNYFALPRFAASFVLLAATGAFAETPANKDEHAASNYGNPVYQRDNTGINERDRSDQTLTADRQSNEAASLEVTKKIRQAIVERDDLSSYAHNVKIVTNDGGLVTLRGPVRNDKERSMLGQIAMDIAGRDSVRNELEVAPEKKNS